MRILLPNGEQQKFLEKILSKISVTKAAKICKRSERTIRDWRREKFLMDKDALLTLCLEVSVFLPENFEEKDNYWYATKGAKLGGIMGSSACIKKYGCVGGPNRKKAWYKWRNKRNKFDNDSLFMLKPINRPRKSKKLAEFIGIMLGDGGFTSKNRQIQITLNNRDDKEYIKFVSGLIYELFNRKPSVFKCKDAMASKICVSSINLVNYLLKLGMKAGNKIEIQVDIPDWIKNNKSYSLACVRGLIDTDGCVFNHQYYINDKLYSYKKITFTTYSQPMLKSVFKILQTIGLNPRLSNNRDVRIDSQNDMQMYFNLVGSSNLKHLNKYYK